MNENNRFRRVAASTLAGAALACALFAACVRPAAATEGFDDPTEGYHQCVLAAMRGTRSMTAVQMMQNACQKVWYESSMLRDTDRNVYVCLLRSLPGVDNDYAAQVIYSSCVQR